MYDGQSSEDFPVDHHQLLSKRRNDTELYWDMRVLSLGKTPETSREVYDSEL